MKNYYDILGVTKNASDEEIKSAYRKLAHKYHPNRPGGDEKKMKEINEAYEILSNKSKRGQYDRFGSVGGQAGFGGNPFSGGINMEFDPSAFGDLGDLGDIFSAFFEGAGMKQKRRTYNRGSDIKIGAEISLEDAFSGTVKEIRYRTQIKCEKCGGAGHDAKAGLETCPVCAGRGEIRESRNSFFGNFVQVKQCAKCFGTGEIPKKICEDCHGTGRKIGEKIARAEILQGIQDGQIIKVSGFGETGERNAGVGDLYVVVKIKPHPVFERRGDDLVVRKEASLIDILLGRKIKIQTISKNDLSIEVPANFNLKNEIRIPGEGMPHLGSFGRGSLLVDLEVKTPKKLSAKAKKLLEDLEGEME